MPLIWRYEADSRVPVFVVVPGDKPPKPGHAPLPRKRKGLSGILGRYLTVRKSDSEYGLSLLTRGRLNEVATPRAISVARSVAPFIGPPLSA